MYFTVQEAQEYYEQYRLIFDAWTDAGYREQEVALRSASEMIDNLPIVGTKAVAGQDHAFPRAGQSEVPVEIKRACAEIAYALLDGVDPEREYRELEVRSSRYANIHTSYSLIRLQMSAYGIPSYTAWKYICKWVNTPQTINRSKS